MFVHNEVCWVPNYALGLGPQIEIRGMRCGLAHVDDEPRAGQCELKGIIEQQRLRSECPSGCDGEHNVGLR